MKQPSPPTDRVDDPGIKRDVLAALYRIPAFVHADVQVEVHLGVTTLSGVVPDSHLACLVVRAAEITRGVLEVRRPAQKNLSVRQGRLSSGR